MLGTSCAVGTPARVGALNGKNGRHGGRQQCAGPSIEASTLRTGGQARLDVQQDAADVPSVHARGVS